MIILVYLCTTCMCTGTWIEMAHSRVDRPFRALLHGHGHSTAPGAPAPEVPAAHKELAMERRGLRAQAQLSLPRPQRHLGGPEPLHVLSIIFSSQSNTLYMCCISYYKWRHIVYIYIYRYNNTVPTTVVYHVTLYIYTYSTISSNSLHTHLTCSRAPLRGTAAPPPHNRRGTAPAAVRGSPAAAAGAGAPCHRRAPAAAARAGRPGSGPRACARCRLSSKS